MPHKTTEQKREYFRRWRAKHAAEVLEYARAWRKANPEKTAEYIERWQNANAEKVVQDSASRYQRNKDKIKKQHREHPEIGRAAYIRRLAKLRSCTTRHTVADEKTIWKRQRHRCGVPNCNHPISDKGKDKYHIDHVTPVSKGGSDDLANLQILCGFHNRRKHAKHPDRWAEEIGLLFC